MIQSILTENGFTEKQAAVYLAVLAAGEAPVSRIAHAAKIARPTVYTILADLKTQGIVTTTTRKGIVYASALPPRVLIDRFKRSAAEAEAALPQLLEMAYSSPLKPRIQFFETMEGLQEILRDFSHAKDDTMFFSDYASMPPALYRFLWKEIIPERKRRRSFGRGLLPRNPVNEEARTKDDQRFAEHRLIDFPQPKNPLELLLYDNTKTAFLSLVPNEYFGIIIDSRAIHETLKNIFQLVWAAAKEH